MYIHVCTINFVVVTIQNNIFYICFLLEGQSVDSGHPVTVECNPVLSHVCYQSFENPTHLEVLHEGTAVNTLRCKLFFSFEQLKQAISYLRFASKGVLMQNFSHGKEFDLDENRSADK